MPSKQNKFKEGFNHYSHTSRESWKIHPNIFFNEKIKK